MTEPMEMLYTYAQEGSVGLEHLDALLEEQSQCDFYRGQALFRAGFSLAVELMRE